ncbi:hypothetical protein C2G38_2203316 [Gigaspora rosea]|uniref:Uncharacterized protein n=1 Tax=Gigaspora rosea TaxID=44941 RepID=A0A397UML0_9GLOM|nr:hypothetical protein C2G38_2203316 [Gigaspora rosea]
MSYHRRCHSHLKHSFHCSNRTTNNNNSNNNSDNSNNNNNNIERVKEYEKELKKAQDKLAYLRTVLLVSQYKQIYDSKYRNDKEKEEVNENEKTKKYEDKEIENKNKDNKREVIIINND